MSRKYGTITAKDLTGLYEVYYRSWKIEFPCMSKTFIFVGSLDDAKIAANKIQKHLKWLYSPKIREIIL